MFASSFMSATIIAALCLASCGLGTGLQAHPLKHWNWSADLLPLGKIRLMTASTHGSQGNYASGNSNTLPINPYLFGVFLWCLCQENHPTLMSSQIWISRAAILMTKISCSLLLLNELSLFHGNLSAFNMGFSIGLDPKWRMGEPAYVISLIPWS